VHGEPVVPQLLDELVSEIRGILGPDLVGIYVYGSWVSGGFVAGVSDLDLVAVTSMTAGELDLAAIDRMHHEFAGRNAEWDDRIEVVYVGRDALLAFRTSPDPVAVISPGEPFHLRHEPVGEWLQNWYLVRETGVTLYGPDPGVVVPSIAWTDYVDATARYAIALGRQSFTEDSPGSIAYMVLTMCRALMTVRTQSHPSKQEAAAWARKQLPEWARVIDTALRCRLARGASGYDDVKSRATAARFIRWAADAVADAV